jgi:hypothetical protein
MSGPVAQLVAHLHGMQGVRGSNPLRSTKTKSLPFGGGIFSLRLCQIFSNQTVSGFAPRRLNQIAQ